MRKGVIATLASYIESDHRAQTVRHASLFLLLGVRALLLWNGASATSSFVNSKTVRRESCPQTKESAEPTQSYHAMDDLRNRPKFGETGSKDDILQPRTFPSEVLSLYLRLLGQECLGATHSHVSHSFATCTGTPSEDRTMPTRATLFTKHIPKKPRVPQVRSQLFSICSDIDDD